MMAAGMKVPSASARSGCSGEPGDVFSVFDSLTVTTVESNDVGANCSIRQEIALDDLTIIAGATGRPLTDVGGGAPGGTTLITGADPAESPALRANLTGSAVDQVFGLVPDADSQETVIGDLAFEQLSSDALKAGRRARYGRRS
jgi:hypothetical protein